MDFMSDRLDDGRRIRILTVEDVFSDTSTSTARHSRVTGSRRPTPQARSGLVFRGRSVHRPAYWTNMAACVEYGATPARAGKLVLCAPSPKWLVTKFALGRKNYWPSRALLPGWGDVGAALPPG